MKVELVSHDASDLKCVNAARVSYNTHHEELTLGDEKLVDAMLREHHGSVFEHSTFTFRVEVPIAVKNEWQRHRAGHSYNEISGRYVQLEKKFDMPQPRRQTGKSMEYEYEELTEFQKGYCEGRIGKAYEAAYKLYEELLRDGIAKEVARYVLPLGIMTKFYWTCNARSLMHFLALRTAPQAMKEIRDRAWEADTIFGKIMPITYVAFCENGRIAP